MKSKLYKFNGEKNLDKQTLLKLMKEKLEECIQTSEDFLSILSGSQVKNFISENEDASYILPLEEKLIALTNNSWEKGIKKGIAKNREAIKNDDLEFLITDIEKAYKLLPKVNKQMNNLLHDAESAMLRGSNRYSTEIYKFIQKSMTISKEYYQEQKKYIQKSIVASKSRTDEQSF